MKPFRFLLCRERTAWRSETSKPQQATTPAVNAARWRALLLAALATFALGQPCPAQILVRVQHTSISAASNPIFAQADYLRAQGDFLVSSSIARKGNAEAAMLEMDNAVQWVNTYFERRRLNREYRAIENPGFVERQDKRRERYRRIIAGDLQGSLGTDLSGELNWMLRELLANTSFSAFMSDHPKSLLSSPDNLTLSADDKRQIRVSEGKVAGGKSLVFRLDTADVLETHWPVALRDERFQAAREAFEDARDCALGDLKIEHEITSGNQGRLMKAVDGLSEQFNAAWPRERRQSPADFLRHLSGKRYLQSLAVSTYRLIETQSSATFDDSYRFRGKTVGELLQHLMSKGLEFAPPEAGGEAVYRKLFSTVRAFYLKLVPEPNN
jgi:hypothetical protein